MEKKRSPWRNFSCSPGSHPPSQHQFNIRNPSWSSTASLPDWMGAAVILHHHHPRSPDLCQHQILEEAQGKPRLQRVCLQDPSLSVLPTCAHQNSFLLLQDVPETSTPEQAQGDNVTVIALKDRAEEVTSAQSSESLLSLHRRLL